MRDEAAKRGGDEVWTTASDISAFEAAERLDDPANPPKGPRYYWIKDPAQMSEAERRLLIAMAGKDEMAVRDTEGNVVAVYDRDGRLMGEEPK
jgi:hypothetical protein